MLAGLVSIIKESKNGYREAKGNLMEHVFSA